MNPRETIYSPPSPCAATDLEAEDLTRIVMRRVLDQDKRIVLIGRIEKLASDIKEAILCSAT